MRLINRYSSRTEVVEWRIIGSVEVWSLEDGQTVVDERGGTGCSLPWLQEHVVPKLCRWSKEETLNTEQTSLTLISVRRYNECYQYLKQKYGIHLVQVTLIRTFLYITLFSSD